MLSSCSKVYRSNLSKLCIQHDSERQKNGYLNKPVNKRSNI